nr:30S ribosomal protein S17 [Candidatus Sigynarchaeota archaeon]
MVTKNIGIKIATTPQRECEDQHCPFHGEIAVRGRVWEGIVASTKRQKTVTVRHDYLFYIKKYKRYERRNSKKSVHCPPCIDVNEGDTVLFMETRKISKTVTSVVIENKTASIQVAKGKDEPVTDEE